MNTRILLVGLLVMSIAVAGCIGGDDVPADDFNDFEDPGQPGDDPMGDDFGDEPAPGGDDFEDDPMLP